MENKPQYIISIVILVLLLLNSFFVLEQRQQALVVQFGEVKKVIKTPGLKFKMPIIQDVVIFDNRILDLNADPRELIAADQKRLIVDAFAKYQIVDPLKFYQTVRDEIGVRNRLNSILDSSLRQVLGSVPLNTLLTSERVRIMRNITNIVDMQTSSFGIKVVDVRIMRADLPKENSEAIYRRMQTEREKEAKQLRAQGEERAQGIRSRAEKDRVIIIAEARKKSQIMRGEGDGEAAKIFADAFNRDPEFSNFYRSMQAYRETLKKDDTTILLSPDKGFLKYFE